MGKYRSEKLLKMQTIAEFMQNLESKLRSSKIGDPDPHANQNYALLSNVRKTYNAKTHY